MLFLKSQAINHGRKKMITYQIRDRLTILSVKKIYPSLWIFTHDTSKQKQIAGVIIFLSIVLLYSI